MMTSLERISATVQFQEPDRKEHEDQTNATTERTDFDAYSSDSENE